MQVIPSLPSKPKDVLTTFSQRCKIGCIDVVSFLEMKVSPTSVDNVVSKLKTESHL